MSDNTQTSITRVLVANRGEVVSRVARTAARMGIGTVAVYTESDVDTAYVNDVDVAIYLGDDSDSSPYLDIEAIIAAAKASDADAIHPGYGFLAENAEFAEACAANGLTWIGPTPDSMRLMAGKIRSKEIARDAGVPVLESIRIGDDLDAVRELAQRVGLPLLIKPSAGGGGKGMHRIDTIEGLDDVVAGARREASSSFGDDTLFVERYVERARHVEVQVFGDQFGNVIHVGDRDCSIQRRHQKIVEEAPAPGLSDGIRAELLRSSAVALAERIGYVGAGTVEYLLFDDQIAFLEMNTRLQVEHPVTEEISGLDLVELQIRVARRERLPLVQEDIALQGHAVEVRLYAEDPSNDYLPSPGLVRALRVPTGPRGRWELGVGAGSRVSSRYDPMIAKIVATGSNRQQALTHLSGMLSGLRVHGVMTNRTQLEAIVSSAGFLAGDLSTAFLDERPELSSSAPADGIREFHAVAAALHRAFHAQEMKTVQRFAPYGWRSMRTQDQLVVLHQGLVSLAVRFRQERDGTWSVDVDGQEHRVRVFDFGDEHIDLEVDCRRRTVQVSAYPDEVIVDSATSESRFVEKPPLQETAEAFAAGSCVAPVPGKVVGVEVSERQRVDVGDPLVVLEAMKMEHRLTATGPGVVARVLVSVGDSVEYQQLLVDVRPDDAKVGAP